MSSDAAQLRERFREIGIERIRALNQDVLALEQGDADEGTVDRAMREIHTLKGESRMLGLGALNRVAHRTEDLLLHARQAGRLQDAEWLQHVYAGLDLLAELIEERGEAASRADDPRAEAFVERAEGLLDGVGAPAAALAAPPAASKEAAPPPPPRPRPATAPATWPRRSASPGARSTRSREPPARSASCSRTCGSSPRRRRTCTTVSATC